MRRVTSRRTAGLAAGLALVAGFTLSACAFVELPVDPGEAGAQATASIDPNAGGIVEQEGDISGLPESWPSAVPAFDGGTLSSSQADPTGEFFLAVYDVTSSPEAAFDAYAATMTAAGFTQGEVTKDDVTAVADFTGNGFMVNAYAGTDPNTNATTLTLTVQTAQ